MSKLTGATAITLDMGVPRCPIPKIDHRHDALVANEEALVFGKSLLQRFDRACYLRRKHALLKVLLPILTFVLRNLDQGMFSCTLIGSNSTFNYLGVVHCPPQAVRHPVAIGQSFL